MSIIFNEIEKTLTINTAKSTYQMKIGKYGHLLHLYYGKKAAGSMDYLLSFYDRGFSGNPYEADNDRTYSLDMLPQEYPGYGNGDYRVSAIDIKNENGVYGTDLRYKSHSIKGGKYNIPGLPAVYCEEAESLEVILEDEAFGVRVKLLYSAIDKLDVITRATVVENISDKRITVGKAYSGSVDFISGDFDFIHFYGRHGMERNMERVPVMKGVTSIGSNRGTSSHQQNPFVILSSKDAGESHGECYGFSLLYSGNFKCQVEKDQMNQTRVSMGVNDDMFEYPLLPGACFNTPELVMAYANGFNELSWNFHRLVRTNITRGKYKNAKRPILINNWEATYFDFDGDKILDIAKQASELGVEMLVLDDGWFGKRDNDFCALGDWFVNEEKLGGNLGELVEKINDMGMKFGIWIEPEMISEDSKLYKAHPDWAFSIPGRKPVRGRYQLVLDFSRKEVVDNIYSQIKKVIDSANVEYIKMDMNRSIMDVCTAVAKEQNQGKILYDYVLGVYDFLERLNSEYPDILIEGCSGGGGRFDMGMLYYTPQIWCSDNTDAIERIKIQHGTSFGYPISTMGAHVSAVPNHQTGRSVSIQTRGIVARAGTFGYELDLNKITDEEKAIVKNQIVDCKKFWELTHEGRYYRLTNPMENREIASWEFVSENAEEALVSVVTLDTHCNAPLSYIRLEGLDENAVYEEVYSGKKYSGAALMNAGFFIPMVLEEYCSMQYYFIKSNNL